MIPALNHPPNEVRLLKRIPTPLLIAALFKKVAKLNIHVKPGYYAPTATKYIQ
jgi:hypothetical protein